MSMKLGYMGNLCGIFAISLRSCTERYGGHLFVVLPHHRGVALSGTSTPGCGSIRLGSLSCRRLQPWVLWDIYERYLLFLCGAVLRGAYGSSRKKVVVPDIVMMSTT